MARPKIVRKGNRRKKVDGKRRNSASTGMLRDVAEDILVKNGLGHARQWWNENPYGPPTHNIATHTYGDLNSVNNINGSIVRDYQLNKIRSLEGARFKQAEQILKTSGFNDINNFIKILNTKSDNELLDFNEVTQNIFDNLSLIGYKVSHLDKNDKYKNEDNATKVLEEIQEYYNQIADTLNLMTEDLKSGRTTMTLIQELNKQMKDIKSALGGSSSSVDVLAGLSAQFKHGSALLKTKGIALEEMGTEKIKKEFSKVMKQFGENMLYIVHSGQQLVDKTSDKSDIRIMLFDKLFDNIENRTYTELIKMQDISAPIRQTISDLNIQAKSGRSQLVWNNKSKYTYVADKDLTTTLNGQTAFHYLDLLKTLSQENTNKGIWQEIKKTSKYYDLIAAYGLSDKLGDIINLSDNFNTILLTSKGFETYYSWFERRLKAADHIVKLRDSINLTNFGGGSHKVVTGRIALGNKK